MEYVIVMKDDLEQTVNAMDQIYKVNSHIPAAKCMLTLTPHCLSWLFPVHFNTYVMGLRPSEIF